MNLKEFFIYKFNSLKTPNLTLKIKRTLVHYMYIFDNTFFINFRANFRGFKVKNFI
jgi:hypothetical protein